MHRYETVLHVMFSDQAEPQLLWTSACPYVAVQCSSSTVVQLVASTGATALKDDISMLVQGLTTAVLAVDGHTEGPADGRPRMLWSDYKALAHRAVFKARRVPHTNTSLYSSFPWREYHLMHPAEHSDLVVPYPLPQLRRRTTSNAGCPAPHWEALNLLRGMDRSSLRSVVAATMGWGAAHSTCDFTEGGPRSLDELGAFEEARYAAENAAWQAATATAAAMAVATAAAAAAAVAVAEETATETRQGDGK